HECRSHEPLSLVAFSHIWDIIRIFKQVYYLRDFNRDISNVKDSGTNSSLSVILPVHNAEKRIAGAVHELLDTFNGWNREVEVIVVDNGSSDRTGAVVDTMVAANPLVRVISLPRRQGYGIALRSGLEKVTKDLVLFMDIDGQFDIRDIETFFSYMEDYDAVLGYRVDHSRPLGQRLKDGLWRIGIGMVFKVYVRDINCGFKLYRATFFRKRRFETRSAMISTEMLYKFVRAGHTYAQMGVHRLPRKPGWNAKGTPSVGLRALYELIEYSWKWNLRERTQAIAKALEKI
ncbi:MAG: glycosyltransferase family 2 protein, partial [Chloroflexota bacterium]|nr:glycosyltransferase family 2 protein [Chloroflexota bacterium]